MVGLGLWVVDCGCKRSVAQECEGGGRAYLLMTCGFRCWFPVDVELARCRGEKVKIDAKSHVRPKGCA